MRRLVLLVTTAGLLVSLAVPALASASSGNCVLHVGHISKRTGKWSSSYYTRAGRRVRAATCERRSASPARPAPSGEMKWYRDRDGNLLPRPASDDPYLDAWLDDYFTS
jgi:hypothetical protein